MSLYRIGTSGWHYEHWKGVFYDPGLPKSKWLEAYAENFDTVELNSSFYRLPSEKTFDNWRDTSPEGFCFSVKVSRFITHVKKLNDCREPLNKFLERVTILQDKLGPLLYQLPSGLHREDARLESFLKLLPRGLQHVFEFRHQSWLEESVFDLLRKYSVGFCVFDMAELSCPVVATADFAYIRFHGPAGLYSSLYPDEMLEDWFGRIKALGSGLETVYIYFNNDTSGYAIQNAKKMKNLLQN